MFHANFDTFYGTANLDNIHFFTKQKCIPRWSRIKDMKFNDITNILEHNLPTPMDMRAYDFSYHNYEVMKKRHDQNKLNRGMTSIEECARYEQICDQNKNPYKIAYFTYIV